MKIEILCTGDEILSGKTVNTNYSYMARRLVENGFAVYWGTTVGDDRDSLQTAFSLAAGRADVVIVNGGLGPTVDDLSQEVAAMSAGVGLVLHEAWLERMRGWYERRGRKMPNNNEKQAMLPDGAEFIDNPIGTACGFAVTIDQARFYFTPGVPREMRRMIDEQVIPRLQEARGHQVFTRVKRFHTFGIGESRADLLLDGVEAMAADGAVKLGFQSHYPQLETKLTVQGSDPTLIDQILAPIEAAVRQRYGDFILAEDDRTLEGEIVDALIANNGSLSLIEMHTAGRITTRLQHEADDSGRIVRSIVSCEPDILFNSIDRTAPRASQHGSEVAEELARALRINSDSTYAMVVLMAYEQLESEEEGQGELIADIRIAISDHQSTSYRHARLPGSREWSCLGAAELAMDCLRRFLLGLPVYQQIDFEQH